MSGFLIIRFASGRFIGVSESDRIIIFGDDMPLDVSAMVFNLLATSEVSAS